MIGVVTGRLLGAVPILLLVSLITFGILHLIPGDPAAVMAGLSATPAEVQQIRTDLGLDQPLWGQLLHWYGGLLHGDLGRSLLLGQDVLQAVWQRLPVTLSISLYGLALTLLIGVAGGVLAALRHNTWVDQAAMVVAMLGISMPSFFFGPLLVLLFAVKLGWLPSGGYVPFMVDPLGWLSAATLPAVSLALLQVGLLARITRSTMLEVLRQDYVRTARAKGLPGWSVVGKHALANAMIPIITVIGIAVSLLLSGSVVIETIFSVPGIGQLLTQAVLNRDYPLVQGGLLLLTTVLVLVNIVVDVLYAAIDPRACVWAASVEDDEAPARPWRDTASRLLHHRLFLLGMVLFSVVLIAGVSAPWAAGADPARIAMRFRFRPPSLQFPFGTDNLGRSLWSRVLWGAQLSMIIGASVVALNAVFGTVIGALAGYVRPLDKIIMGFNDAMMAFPAVLLAIGITAALGSSVLNVIIALSIVYVPRTARIVRASVIVLQQMEYVQAAVAAGAGHWRILTRHILPNALAPLIVQLSFLFAYAVLTEATLSFLGLGAVPPTPTWGNIMADGRQYLTDAPWIITIPGVALMLTVLGLNLLGDGLRDVLDPRLRIQP